MYSGRSDGGPRPAYPDSPPSSIPESDDAEYVEYSASMDAEYSRTWRDWLAALSPIQQLGYGCLGIMLVSAAVLYCVGAATFLVRPMLVDRAAVTPTVVVRPTLVPTPTQLPRPTAFIQLPAGTLIATPTQAPMPSREPATPSPTPETVNGMTVTPLPSPTGKASPTPTRRPSSSVTPMARP